MKFTAVLCSAVLAIGVCAQNATSITPPSSTVALSPAQSSEVACIAACNSSDQDCKNKCIQAITASNPIEQCQKGCPQGNGTMTDDANFKACLIDCISSSGGSGASSAASVATPTASGSGSSGNNASPSSSQAATDTGSGSGSGSSTSTATSSSASASKSSAADSVRIGSSALGLLGMFAAMVVL